MKITPHKHITQDEMQRIHEASMTILENTGMLIEHPVALRMLSDAGAKVNFDNRIVKFPSDLIEKSIKTIPKQINLAGRETDDDVVVDCASAFRVRCTTGPSAMIDYQNGEYRDATINDQKELAIISDALKHISFASPLTVNNVPKKTADLHATKCLLENQRMHFMNLTMGSKNLKYQIEMQLAVRGSKEDLKRRPLFHPIACMISPLFLPEDDVEIIMIAGKYGLLIKVPVLPMLGANTPVTLAGTIAQINAEVIGSFTLIQTLFPGNPVLYYFLPSIMNMRKGNSVYGAPEDMLMAATLIQMGKDFYKLPTETSSIICDGIIPGQTLYQKGISLLNSCLSGANLIAGAGSLDGGMASSLVQLVIDDEIVGMTRRLLDGFEISEDKLALDVIDRIGPRGNFLTDEHTSENIRKENIFDPSIFNWEDYKSWKEEPKDLNDKARETVVNILKSHKVTPLDKDIINELDKILKAADQEIN